MADKSRIPRGIDEFNPYLSTTNSYLIAGDRVTNAVRLGILPAEVEHWSNNFANWSVLYQKYCDRKNSRTTAVIEQLNLIIADTIEFDHTHHILDRIASSPNVTVTDLTTFNIKKGLLEKTTHSSSVTPITELVVPSVQLVGGGVLAIKCRCATGESASIIEDADCVQYRFKVGTTAPLSVEEEGLKSDLSSRASFNLNAGAENSGKYLYVYFRWYNTKRPNLAGPWSPLIISLIP
jgi:hypothetical protein